MLISDYDPVSPGSDCVVIQFCVYLLLCVHPLSGVVGKMLAWHAINLGSILGQGYIVTRMITVMAVLCHWIPSGR